MNYGTHSNTAPSDRDSWRTPQQVFEWLDRVYRFSHDTACTDENALRRPVWWRQSENDALACDWRGTCFCNPPYSNIAPWVDKAIESARHGATTVMLIPSPNGENYHARALRHAKRLILINGRLAFINSAGRPVSGNNRGSCVYVFAPGPDQGCAHLSVIDRDEMYK